MTRCCCECEYWEPLPLRQQWGICSGQDLPQYVGMTGAYVLETEDLAACSLFERSLDMKGDPDMGMMDVFQDQLDEYEEYCFERMRDRSLF